MKKERAVSRSGAENWKIPSTAVEAYIIVYSIINDEKAVKFQVFWFQVYASTYTCPIAFKPELESDAVVAE